MRSKQLGDVVFVELPEAGKKIGQGEQAAVVESVKAASEVYAPVSGEVIEANGALEGEPGKVNAIPQAMAGSSRIRIGDAKQLDALMDESAYAEFLKSLG